MKMFVVGVMLFFLSACAQTTLPTSASVADWQDFGKQSALNGDIELTEEGIVKLDKTNRATPELIMAYQSGYQEGKKQYCEQSAYILGVKNMPYFGICDDINPFFKEDYESGRTSTAGEY